MVVGPSPQTNQRIQRLLMIFLNQNSSFVLVFFKLKSDNPGNSAFMMLTFEFVSCPATFLPEANLATKYSYSSFQIKHRIERDSRNWTHDSAISLKH